MFGPCSFFTTRGNSLRGDSYRNVSRLPSPHPRDILDRRSAALRGLRSTGVDVTATTGLRSKFLFHLTSPRRFREYRLDLKIYISQKSHITSRSVSVYKPNFDAFTVKRWPEYTVGGSVVRKLRTDRRTGNFLFVHWITAKTYLEMLYTIRAKWKMFMFYYIFIQKELLFLGKDRKFFYFSLFLSLSLSFFSSLNLFFFFYMYKNNKINTKRRGNSWI